MRIYVIRDLTAEVDSQVFEAKNDAVALRQFVRLTADSDFADEFELYSLGRHDEEACTLDSWPKARVVVSLSVDDSEDEVTVVEEA